MIPYNYYDFLVIETQRLEEERLADIERRFEKKFLEDAIGKQL